MDEANAEVYSGKANRSVIYIHYFPRKFYKFELNGSHESIWCTTFDCHIFESKAVYTSIKEILFVRSNLWNY